MVWTLIVENLKAYSNSNGTEKTFALPIQDWGLQVKDVLYAVVVTDRSGVNAKVGIRHDEGPDKNTDLYKPYATPIAPIAPAAIPDVLRGGTPVGRLMPYFQPKLLVSSTDANQTSVVVSVYAGGAAF